MSVLAVGKGQKNIGTWLPYSAPERDSSELKQSLQVSDIYMYICYILSGYLYQTLQGLLFNDLKLSNYLK